jgi:hypothetical protein
MLTWPLPVFLRFRSQPAGFRRASLTYRQSRRSGPRWRLRFELCSCIPRHASSTPPADVSSWGRPFFPLDWASGAARQRRDLCRLGGRKAHSHRGRARGRLWPRPSQMRRTKGRGLTRARGKTISRGPRCSHVPEITRPTVGCFATRSTCRLGPSVRVGARVSSQRVRAGVELEPAQGTQCNLRSS